MSEAMSDVAMDFAYIHYNGCGDIAMYVSHMPEPGERALSSDIRKIDGGNFVDGEQVRCGSCGLPLKGISTKFIERVTE